MIEVIFEKMKTTDDTDIIGVDTSDQCKSVSSVVKQNLSLVFSQSLFGLKRINKSSKTMH